MDGKSVIGRPCSLTYWLSCIGCCLLLAGCVTSGPEQTLYQQLGGAPVVTQVVDNFIDEIGHDEQIFGFFARADVDRFRRKMIEHLCHMTDGGCAYTGDAMAVVHANMGVSEADFNRIVDLLVNAMTRAGIGHPLQNRVLARMAPLRQQVIYQ